MRYLIAQNREFEHQVGIQEDRSGLEHEDTDNQDTLWKAAAEQNLSNDEDL